jgi:hypothetical protein
MIDVLVAVLLGLAVCVLSAGLIARVDGAERERQRAYDEGYGDGYRAGERAGMGAPSPRYERWDVRGNDDAA